MWGWRSIWRTTAIILTPHARTPHPRIRRPMPERSRLSWHRHKWAWPIRGGPTAPDVAASARRHSSSPGPSRMALTCHLLRLPFGTKVLVRFAPDGILRIARLRTSSSAPTSSPFDAVEENPCRFMRQGYHRGAMLSQSIYLTWRRNQNGPACDSVAPEFGENSGACR